ncbi:hypothetical protein IE81DRAFT_324579 [Ceraceosorus guamensis]|uniref:GST C-terminal domain-containing protein n=1 Tax=Ceraceosorus guamensis TaxID=1522189 RepID=A0A316VWZ1_9BASI|nr:hypothetical protein IE81DRAFT_324579 [Ceraceosorus guamensis]PWN41438.1 hypothetical protein IE81DRAFT_324579 [Ceraceosorus guamensis]
MSAPPPPAAASPRAIVYGYAGSPFFKKLQDLLAWYRVPHAVVQVDMIPPRPMLSQELGITYRRIPVLALDGQLYLDTSLQVEVLEKTFAGKQGHGNSLFGREAELQKRLVANWTDREMFPIIAGLIPPAAWSKEFIDDRKSFSPGLRLGERARPELNKAQLITHLHSLEKTLTESRAEWLLGTPEMSYVDIGCAFTLTWLQLSLKAVPDLLPRPSKDNAQLPNSPFPLVLRWLNEVRKELSARRSALPQFADLKGDEAARLILRQAGESESESESVRREEAGGGHIQADDPSALKRGDLTSVTPRDTGRIVSRSRSLARSGAGGKIRSVFMGEFLMTFASSPSFGGLTFTPAHSFLTIPASDGYARRSHTHPSHLTSRTAQASGPKSVGSSASLPL